MINAGQLREAIRETLKELDPLIPYSEHAIELLMMTAAHESHMGTYLKQVKGPARGIFQIEPNTETDVFKNYLEYKDDLKDFLGLYETVAGDDLQFNLQYQIILARIIYWRIPAGMPKTYEAMADYAKKYWNTYLGKATPEQYLTSYKKYASIET